MKQTQRYFLILLCIIGGFSSVVTADTMTPRETHESESSEQITSIRKLKNTLRNTSEVSNSNAVSAAIDFSPEKESAEQSEGSHFIRLFQGLGLCLGVFCVGLAIAKRINPRLRVTDARRLSVTSRIPLSNKTQLMLVELDGREMLLTVGQEHVSVVDNDSTKSMQRSFQVVTDTEKVEDAACAVSLQQLA